MKNIIIQTAPTIAAYTSFTGACKANGLTYNSLKWRKFPISHNGFEFHKVPLIYVNAKLRNINAKK